MALTDTAIRNAKPASKPRKLADGGGLHLLVAPAGGKLWRLSYRYALDQAAAAHWALESRGRTGKPILEP